MSLDSLQVTDNASAAVATHPRITKEFIENQIAETLWVTGDVFAAAAESNDNEPLYAHLTICVIRVDNGFMTVGKSAPMSPENFNGPLGRQLAYEDAFRQLWAMYAFASLEDEWLLEQEAKAGLNPNNDGESPSPNSAAPTAE